MTREEAYGEARIGGQTRDLTIFDVDVIIDKIYDDFESRNCRNCKHWTYTTMECDIIKSIRPNEPFACNQWKGK